MNRTYCDICGQEMKTPGYEIRYQSMTAQDRPANRHMCEPCFMRLVLHLGKQREEGEEDV